MITVEEYVDQLRLSRQIVKTIASNSYSRDDPTYPAEVENRIRESLLHKESIRLTLLWGGSKIGMYADQADQISLDYIATLQDTLHGLATPSQFTLLFCDMHHVLVNGILYEETTKYHSSLIPMVQERNLKMIRLSDILGNQGIEDYSDKDARRKSHEVFASPKSLEKLCKAANKHSQYKGKLAAQDIARVYVEAELYFLKRLNEEDPRRLFCSFSDPEIQRPIAEAATIPMFYLHSAGKGHHECPWYSKREKN